MATGLEIIARLNGKTRLFKVRHDGYAVEDYVAKFQVPTAKTLQEAIEHFKNWFFDASSYGPEDPDVDVETNFPLGYEFTPTGASFKEMRRQAHDELHAMETKGTLPLDEDLTCGYDDYTLLIDLDNGQFIVNDGESANKDNQSSEELGHFIEDSQLSSSPQKLTHEAIAGLISQISFTPSTAITFAYARQFGPVGMHIRVYDCDGEEWQVLSCPKDEKIISIKGDNTTFSDPSGTNFGLNMPIKQQTDILSKDTKDSEHDKHHDEYNKHYDEHGLSGNPADYVFSISEVPCTGFDLGGSGNEHLITIVESAFFAAEGHIQDQPINDLLDKLPSYIEEINETSLNVLYPPVGKTIADIVAELEQLGMTYSNDLARTMEQDAGDKHYIK
jgi:hypothetical protein